MEEHIPAGVGGASAIGLDRHEGTKTGRAFPWGNDLPKFRAEADGTDKLRPRIGCSYFIDQRGDASGDFGYRRTISGRLTDAQDEKESIRTGVGNDTGLLLRQAGNPPGKHSAIGFQLSARTRRDQDRPGNFHKRAFFRLLSG